MDMTEEPAFAKAARDGITEGRTAAALAAFHRQAKRRAPAAKANRRSPSMQVCVDNSREGCNATAWAASCRCLSRDPMLPSLIDVHWASHPLEDPEQQSADAVLPPCAQRYLVAVSCGGMALDIAL